MYLFVSLYVTRIVFGLKLDLVFNYFLGHDRLDCFFGTPLEKLKYDRIPDMGVFQENFDG